MKPEFNADEQDLLKKLSKKVFYGLINNLRLARLGIYTPFGDIFTYDDIGVLVTGRSGHGKSTLVQYFKKLHPEIVTKKSEDIAPVFCSGNSKPEFFPQNLLSLLTSDGKTLDLIVLFDERAADYDVHKMSYEEFLSDRSKKQGFQREPEAFRRYEDSLRHITAFRIGKQLGYKDDGDLHATYEIVRDIVQSYSQPKKN